MDSSVFLVQCGKQSKLRRVDSFGSHFGAGSESPLQKLKATLRSPLFEMSFSGLKCLDVLCLPALGAFDHIELDLLTFLQAPESARLDGGEMHEYILAILTADETIALGIVKPLHCSCFHCVAISFVLIWR